MSISETISSYRSALKAGYSIATKPYPPEKEVFHINQVFTHSLAENPNPSETERQLFLVLGKYNRKDQTDFSKRTPWQIVPWKERRKINSLHLSGLSVTFADLNDAPIPDYIVPPQDLVDRYYENLLNSDHPLPLHEQFDQVLSIVGPYPTAAAILLMIATRVFARDQDTKILARPDAEAFDKLKYKIAGFRQSWVENEPPDPTGNTYYFWTNMAMNMLLTADGVSNIIVDMPPMILFPHGAWLMEKARKYKVKQPNIVSHKLPSRYGLQIGKNLVASYLSKKEVRVTTSINPA